MILLEGTTGNTGISTCMVGAALGYKVIIVMPEGMSEERKNHPGLWSRVSADPRS